MLKAIHACEDRQAAQDKAEAVIEKLTGMRPKEAACKVREGIEEKLTYYSFSASTGAACGPTIRWSGSCGRSAGVHG
jgi:hypothetical protein